VQTEASAAGTLCNIILVTRAPYPPPAQAGIVSVILPPRTLNTTGTACPCPCPDDMGCAATQGACGD